MALALLGVAVPLYLLIPSAHTEEPYYPISQESPKKRTTDSTGKASSESPSTSAQKREMEEFFGTTETERMLRHGQELQRRSSLSTKGHSPSFPTPGSKNSPTPAPDDSPEYTSQKSASGSSSYSYSSEKKSSKKSAYPGHVHFITPSPTHTLRHAAQKDKPAPLIDSGSDGPEISLFTGATWKPRLTVFGSATSSLLSFDSGNGDSTHQWANKIELKFNLALTASERIFLKLTPVDQDSRYSGINIATGDWTNATNREPHSLFFEGSLLSLFPSLDSSSRLLDLDFTLGRQHLILQDGILLNDPMDALTLHWDCFTLPGADTSTLTLIGAINDIHRGGDAHQDSTARLAALSLGSSYGDLDLHLDAAFLDARTSTGGDSLHLAASASVPIGPVDATLRAASSIRTEDSISKQKAVDNGTLLMLQLSTHPDADSPDALYLNTFGAIDQYTPAALDPAAPGPLSPTGLLFTKAEVGSYQAMLGKKAFDSFGSALGYHLFIEDDPASQLLFEIAFRQETPSQPSQTGGAFGIEYHQRLAEHWRLTLGSALGIFERERYGYGVRSALSFDF